MPAISSGESSEKYHVVMLYDRVASVGRALATYAHLARDLEDDFKPDLRIWRMDVATSEEYSALASVDIAAAEVIIVTVQANQRCPAAFLHWRGGAGEGGSAPRGIIVLVETAGEPVPAEGTWNYVLQGAATQIHPEVFVYEPHEKILEVALQPANSPGAGA